jgi:CheY-like chemotaxis protein
MDFLTKFMKRLQHFDQLHFNAAEGWFSLGNRLDAKEELEQLTPEARQNQAVMELRWHISAQEEKWEACVEIASAVIQQFPKRSFGWLHRSFALHELKRTQEALDLLVPAAGRFPKIWTIPYNLACYSSQLGLMEECGKWLKMAVAINEESAKLAAIDDPDLQPWWRSPKTRHQILVVDDHEGIREVLEAMLETEGNLSVMTAGNGGLALQIAAKQPVDLLISDMMRPGEDVEQFLEKFHHQHPHVPIVLLTGLGFSDEEATALKDWGVSLILPKPFDIHSLVGQISKLLPTPLCPPG